MEFGNKEEERLLPEPSPSARSGVDLSASIKAQPKRLEARLKEYGPSPIRLLLNAYIEAKRPSKTEEFEPEWRKFEKEIRERIVNPPEKGRKNARTIQPAQ